MIDCHHVQEARLELAGGESLAAEQSQAVAQHVAGCPACRAFAQEIDAIEAAVQQSLIADAEHATGGHAARFLEAVAREAGAPAKAGLRPASGAGLRGSGSRRVSSRQRQAAAPFPFRAAGVVALAAGLLLAAGLGLFDGADPQPAGDLQLARGAEQRAYQAGESLRPGDRLQAGAASAFSLPQAQLEPAAGSVVRVERWSGRGSASR